MVFLTHMLRVILFTMTALIRLKHNTAGLPRSGKKVWKMIFFPGQGKVREFGVESGNLQKVQKVREKSGNFKIFSKLMVFGNILCISHCLKRI